MRFSTTAFSPELLDLMNRAFDEACRELDPALMRSETWAVAETMMELRLMVSVAAGERDPERLAGLALQAVDGCRATQLGCPTLNDCCD